MDNIPPSWGKVHVWSVSPFLFLLLLDSPRWIYCTVSSPSPTLPTSSCELFLYSRKLFILKWSLSLSLLPHCSCLPEIFSSPALKKNNYQLTLPLSLLAASYNLCSILFFSLHQFSFNYWCWTSIPLVMFHSLPLSLYLYIRCLCTKCAPVV